MKRLGEILIEHGCLSEDKLKAALDQQKKGEHKLLGQILLENGFVTEEDIVVALATQFNVPYLPVGNFTLNDEVVKQVPVEMIEKYMCIPLDRNGNMMTVVMADPTNEAGLKDLEAATQCKVQVFVSSVTEIVNSLDHQLGIKLKGASSPEQIAKASFKSAVQEKNKQDV